ncbi:hypothetical protein DLM76_11700 [Leptospira yasudae]|uniref:Uncharacterized protein n=1 Tax=Leptospira yasudae TaxID=2202201 RepID=A0ABX9LY03_9LEPT|nr:hypothetical protein [Leptospira yasudae]RHX77700.1 hypothetical protein DLM77_19885 [Leptospira yasudae]RHX93676.1 hypothetical protein DLM76_11700 [Leptospira yasudae]
MRFVFVVLLAYTGIGAEEPIVGNCYSSVNGFIESVYGTQGLNDENVRIHEAIRFSGSFWVVDVTPSKNSERFLLQPSASGEFCLTLSTVALQITEKKRGNTQIVFAKTQPSGNIPALEIYYIRKPKDTRFRIRSCSEISYSDGSSVSRPISCRNVLR